MDKTSLQIMTDAIRSIDPDTVNEETRASLSLMRGWKLPQSFHDVLEMKIHDIYVSLAQWQEQLMKSASHVGVQVEFGAGQQHTAATLDFTAQLNRILKDIDALPDTPEEKKK